MAEIERMLRELFTGDDLIKIIFSNKRKKSIEYNKVTIRPIILQEKKVFQIEYSFDKKVTHENMDQDNSFEKAFVLLRDYFKQVNIFTSKEDIQILASKLEKPRITKSLPTIHVNVYSITEQKITLYRIISLATSSFG